MTLELTLENVELFYEKTRVCGPVNCSFKRGRINLIVGRAGSGKSTLLKTIAGFHDRFSGRILADNQPFKADGNIALAFQNPENLFFNPTVGEEVAFALCNRQDNEPRLKAREWLEKWGIPAEKFWHKHPIELSGGEKRKVALCACTVLLPDVILLDEPFAGLDFSGQKRLGEIIEEIACDHIVLVVTHDPEAFLHFSDTVLYLQNDGALFSDTEDFVRRALTSAGFYPLPNWYQAALKDHDKLLRLPKLKAEAVYNLLRGQATDADYL